MVDSVKILVAVCLALLGLIIIPSLRMAETNESEALFMAEQATREFVDIVRSKGYIDNRDYTVFRRKLDSTGEVFSVEMEHYKKRYEPLYGDPNNYYTFTEKFEIIYDGYYTNEILDRLFPEGTNLPQNSVDRRYNMKVGDLFNIRIESSGVRMSAMIRSMIWQSPSVPMTYHYGGMVRNEAP